MAIARRNPAASRAAGAAGAAVAAADRRLPTCRARTGHCEHFMSSGTLTGQVGLVVGVANKRSLAWAIAQAAAAEGAALVLTYQGERLEENVRELAATLSDPLILPCDVTSDAQLDQVFAAIEQKHGGLDFVVHGAAYADREDLARPFSETSREGFGRALDISAFSLLALARRAAPLMDRRGGGSLLTLSYLGSARVFTNYNVMGVAKAALECSVRYLASELGPRGIRVNAISAGPVKTLAASGISGFSSILQTYRDRAPLRRTIDGSDVAGAAMFLLGPAGRGVTAEVLMVDAGFHAMGI
jgi:enoyl-[acyl-carrier protein] reductase I